MNFLSLLASRQILHGMSASTVSSESRSSPPPQLPLRIKILKFGYSTGLTAVGWDDTLEKLKLTRTKSRVGWILVQALLIFLYQVFLIYQSTVKVLDLEVSESTKIRLRYNTGLWIFMACDHIGDIWSGEYVRLLNGLEGFKKKCGGTLRMTGFQSLCWWHNQSRSIFPVLDNLLWFMSVSAYIDRGERREGHQGCNLHCSVTHGYSHDRSTVRANISDVGHVPVC